MDDQKEKHLPTAFIAVHQVNNQSGELLDGWAWYTNEFTYTVFEHVKQKFEVSLESAAYTVTLYVRPGEKVKSFTIAELGYRSLADLVKNVAPIDPEEYRRSRRKEHHLALVREIDAFVQDLLDEGCIVPSMVSALIHTAKAVAEKNSDIVGEDYFAGCIDEVRDGGEGLHVGKKYR